jgi:hypothetical protein
MTPEQISVINLKITTFITIIGWAVTIIIQFIILSKTKKTEQLNRELAVFRERLNIIKEINSSLVSLTTPFLKLVAYIISGHFNFDEIAKIIGEENEAFPNLLKLLYDPEF